MSAILRFYDRLIDLAALIASLTVAFIALGVTADVGVRFFAGSTIKWILEVSEYLLFAMTFLGAPWVLREGAHTAVDVVVVNLGERGKRVCALVSNVIGLITSAGLLYFGWLATASSRSLGTMIFKSVAFPEWWTLAFIPFCGLMLVIQFIRQLHRAVHGDSSVLARRQATA